MVRIPSRTVRTAKRLDYYLYSSKASSSSSTASYAQESIRLNPTSSPLSSHRYELNATDLRLTDPQSRDVWRLCSSFGT
jgi:hypothetical protein